MHEGIRQIHEAMSHPMCTGIVLTAEQMGNFLQDMDEETFARALGEAIQCHQQPIVTHCGNCPHLHMMAPYDWTPNRIEKWAAFMSPILDKIGFGPVLAVNVYYRPLPGYEYAVHNVGLVMRDE